MAHTTWRNRSLCTYLGIQKPSHLPLLESTSVAVVSGWLEPV
uniref:Uncharacterized protein n=1 Tax=Arundo donax TaxID=35708 RepID=A0A0A8Z1R4_ARUDO